MSEQLEIERKYLIAMPDTQALRAVCTEQIGRPVVLENPAG